LSQLAQARERLRVRRTSSLPEVDRRGRDVRELREDDARDRLDAVRLPDLLAESEDVELRNAGFFGLLRALLGHDGLLGETRYRSTSRPRQFEMCYQPGHT